MMTTETTWMQYGRRQMIDAYQADQDVIRMANDLAKTTNIQAGRDAFQGALLAAIELLTKAAKAGCCTFGASNAASEDLARRIGAGDASGIWLRYLALLKDGGSDESDTMRSAIFDALDKMRRSGKVRFSVVEVKREAGAETVPMKVEIVGMPERITTSDIERDSAGNIKATAQVEKDAA